MLKFEIGDNLKIVSRVAGHGFDNGEIVTVTKLFPNSDDPHYLAENKHGEDWYIGDDEVELVEKGVLSND